MNAFFRLLLLWAFFLLLWLTFVFQVTTAELLAGSAAAALTTMGLTIALRYQPLCFHPKLRWVSQSIRLPGMVAQDLWILCKDLLRLLLRKPSQSQLVYAKFTVHPERCEASAQRALALLFISTSPNSVVLDIDRETNFMLIHNLRPAPLPPLVDKLQH